MPTRLGKFAKSKSPYILDTEATTTLSTHILEEFINLLQTPSCSLTLSGRETIKIIWVSGKKTFLLYE